MDFDDWEIPGNTHPTVVLLPALLAVANETTRGADLAQAYLAGFEVIARLGQSDLGKLTAFDGEVMPY